MISLARAYFIVWLICLLNALSFAAGVAVATGMAIAMVKAAAS